MKIKRSTSGQRPWARIGSTGLGSGRDLAAELESLGDVRHLDGVFFGQVRDRARDAQHAVVRPSRQAQSLDGLQQSRALRPAELRAFF